ncbi:MAG: helix-turn-helix domain-containing protein [Steroidobacteraceae bacterium]
MAELADRHVPLDRLVRGMSSIEERLAGIAPHEAIEIVQTWLLDRIQSRRREVHPDVVAATRRIAAGEGRERVEAVADAIGVGRRRLERHFRLQIGVGPKEFASLVRFGAVTSDLEGKSWADAALRGGYADQAHFIRDFKARTGLTPTQFQRHPA